MRGRPPKPTELKLLQGNPGKRRLPSPEQRLQPTRLEKPPNPPSWLCSEGKRFWKELAPELHRLGILTVLDEGTLAVTCNAYGLAARSQARLERLERKRPKTPEDEDRVQGLIARALAHVDRFTKLYRSLISEVGLSATARTRIEMATTDEVGSVLGGLRARAAATRKQA